MARKRAFDRTIAEIYKGRRDPEGVRLEELAALVELGLGHRLDDRTFEALAAVQDELRKAQRSLAAELQDGKRSPDDYVTALHSALHSWADRAMNVLGRERFDAIYGKAGAQPEVLIDRETFLNEHEHRRASAH